VLCSFVSCIAIAGELLVSGGGDGRLFVWNWQTYTALATIVCTLREALKLIVQQQKEGAVVRHIAVNEQIVAVSYEGSNSVEIRKLATLELLNTIEFAAEPLYHVFDANGNVLVCHASPGPLVRCYT
jgi:hypothetical protein